MSKHNVLAALAVVVAAGCATPPVSPEFKPATDTTGGEADLRTRARLRTELAAGYIERGNLNVALEEVSLALRTDPNYGPAYNVIALIYATLKEDRLAEQNFGQALRINPQDSDANHNYGWFLCQRKREAESIKYFMAAVRNPLYQTPERSYVNAAMCARTMGDVSGAEEHLLNALRARPGYPLALYHLAEISYQRGNFLGARAYLGNLTRVVTFSAELLWLGVRVERKLGDRNAEESYALQLRNNFPNSSEARALLAGQYEMTGSAPAALREDHASPGVALRAARTAQNLSVGEVARQLRLSVAQVEALEAGAFERLPGPVFARGFIRNYARLLKLDADVLLRTAPPALPDEEPPPIVEAPQGATLPVARGPRWGRYALGAAVIALALAVYEFYPFEQAQIAPPRAKEPAKPQQAPPQAAVSVPVAPAAEDGAMRPGARDVAESVADKPLEPARTGSTQDATAPAADRGEIVLTFEGDSWIEIREQRGGVIFSQVSRRGAEHKVTGTPPFILVVGNASAVRLTYNDRRVDLDRYSRNNVARLTLE